MKKVILLSALFLSFLSVSTYAQVFPVYETFETYSPFATPPDFTGDITVYLIHGVGRSQALASNMNTFNTRDSIITPLYGPIDGGAVLLYEYRFANGVLYPNQTVNLVTGDSFETYITTDGTNYQLIASVDQTNYTPDTTFMTNSLSLNSYAGQNIRLKFVIRRGNNPDEYWVDIDNIFIFDVTAVAGLTKNDFAIYPTLVSDRLNYTVSKPVKAVAEIYSISGQKVKSERIDTEKGGNFDLSGLTAGSYILRLTGNSSISYRFEKQ